MIVVPFLWRTIRSPAFRTHEIASTSKNEKCGDRVCGRDKAAAVRPGYLAGYVPAGGQRAALGDAVPAWPPKGLPARRAAFAADAFVDYGA
jgi:hypothetical protein